MKNIYSLLSIAIALLVACNSTPQPNPQTPAPEPVIADSSHSTANTNKNKNTNTNTKPTVWTMEIGRSGIVIFGKEAIVLSNLQSKLSDSLKTYFAQTKTLPDTIVYTTKGEVLMGVRGTVRDAIDASLAQARQLK